MLLRCNSGVATMSGRKRVIAVWFIADILLGLLPPLYWAASGPTPPIFGLPLSVVYFLLVGVFISASVVVAFTMERREGSLT